MAVCVVGIRWIFFLLCMFSIISKSSKIVRNTFLPLEESIKHLNGHTYIHKHRQKCTGDG